MKLRFEFQSDRTFGFSRLVERDGNSLSSAGLEFRRDGTLVRCTARYRSFNARGTLTGVTTAAEYLLIVSTYSFVLTISLISVNNKKKKKISIYKLETNLVSFQ